MITWGAIIPALVGAALTILVTLLTLSFKYGRLLNRMENIESRLRRLESIYDNFVGTLINKAAGGDFTESARLNPLLDKFDKLLASMSVKGNPVTTDDINKLREYRNKIAHGSQFSLSEYQEFEKLSRKIEEEIPRNARSEYDWVIAGLLGIALGLVIATLITRK